MTVGQFLLHCRTIRHLRFAQIAGQIRVRFERRLQRPERLLLLDAPPLTLREVPQHDVVLTSPVPGQVETELMSGHFCFLNQSVRLGFPPTWDFDRFPSRLWEYNLHYFDWLWGLARLDCGNWDKAKLVVSDWISHNPPGRRAVGWEPYPLSLRVTNWTLLFFVLRRELVLSEADFAQALWQSLWRQGQWLSEHLETHIQANHLLENLAALTILGSVMSGPEAERWLTVAVPLLRREAAEQILPDGCHYERSPMYHLRVLWLMETLAQVGVQEVKELAQTSLPKMRESIECLRHPDGQIALLNDSAHGIYIDAPSDTVPQVGPFCLPEAGYYGWRGLNGDYIVIDAAPIGPDYQPGHAHADYLTFELSLRGRRVITDTGVHDYSPGPTRSYARSTAAHNTVEIAGMSSCEVWGAFRVGRRIVPRVLCWEPAPNGFNLEAEHAGYAHLISRALHRRGFEWRNGTLRIDDYINNRRSETVIGRFHLAPGVKVGVAGSGAHCRIGDLKFEVLIDGPGSLRSSESDYYPGFGSRVRRPVLEYVIDDVCCPHWTTFIKPL